MTENGHLIKARRASLGLTQKEVAVKLGMDRSQFNQIERGNRGVGPSVAARIAAVLGGDPEEYVTSLARTPIDVAEDLVTRLDAGEAVPRDLLERVAAQLDETSDLSARLADRLRAGASAARSRA